MDQRGQSSLKVNFEKKTIANEYNTFQINRQMLAFLIENNYR